MSTKSNYRPFVLSKTISSVSASDELSSYCTICFLRLKPNSQDERNGSTMNQSWADELRVFLALHLSYMKHLKHTVVFGSSCGGRRPDTFPIKGEERHQHRSSLNFRRPPNCQTPKFQLAYHWCLHLLAVLGPCS